MRFCEECGAPLEDDAKFCEECGTPVEPLAEEDDTAVADESASSEPESAADPIENGSGQMQEAEAAADETDSNKQTDAVDTADADSEQVSATVTEERETEKKEEAISNKPAEMNMEQKALVVDIPMKEDYEQRSVDTSDAGLSAYASAPQSTDSSNTVSSAPQNADTANTVSSAPQNADTANTVSNAAQNTGPSNTVSNEDTAAQTDSSGKKKHTVKIILIIAAVVVVAAAITVAALFATGVLKSGSGEAAVATEIPAEEGLADVGQEQSEPTQEPEPTLEPTPEPTPEPVQTENPVEALKNRWQHTFVADGQYGKEEMRIKVRSEEMIVITIIYYDYEDVEAYREKVTATFTEDKNTVTVDDYDGSTFYSATLSSDNTTISLYDKEGYEHSSVYVRKDGSGSAKETSSGEYIIPDSSDRKLTKSDVKGLSSEQLRLARNEIYARHGRMFNDSELQSYFDAKSWYEPTTAPEDFDEQMELSKIERANIKLISKYE